MADKTFINALRQAWNLSELKRKGFKVVDKKKLPKKQKKAPKVIKNVIPKNLKVKNAKVILPYQFFRYRGVNYKNEYNLRFPSALEWYAYDVFTRNGLGFDYQFPFELQQKMEHTRAIKTIIDFVFDFNGFKVIIDTKGWQTSESKLKIKMLKAKLAHENIKYTIILLKTPKEILEITKKLLIARKNGIFVP